MCIQTSIHVTCTYQLLDSNPVRSSESQATAKGWILLLCRPTCVYTDVIHVTCTSQLMRRYLINVTITDVIIITTDIVCTSPEENHQTLDQWWLSVGPASPTLRQHWIDVSYVPVEGVTPPPTS